MKKLFVNPFKNHSDKEIGLGFDKQNPKDFSTGRHAPECHKWSASDRITKEYNPLMGTQPSET